MCSRLVLVNVWDAEPAVSLSESADIASSRCCRGFRERGGLASSGVEGEEWSMR